MRARQPAGVMPQLWFCPTPGTPDLVDILLSRTPDVAQTYIYPFLATAPAFCGENVLGTMDARGLPASLAARGIPLALECGAIKEPAQNDGRLITSTQEAIANVVFLGGTVDTILMDEPIHSAQTRCTPPMAIPEILDQLNAYQAALTGIRVGLIEAYPATLLQHVRQVIDGLTVPVSCLHLDVDLNAIRQFKMGERAKRELRQFHEDLRARGIPFGVCVWGHDARTADSFIASARKLFAFYQETFITGDWPERVIVQSWARGHGIVSDIPSAVAQWGLYEEIRRSLEA